MARGSIYNKKEIGFQVRVNHYYFKNWYAFSMDCHIHEEMEIMYVLSGKATTQVGQEFFTMQAGDMVMIDAGVSHALKMTQEETCRMLNLEFCCAEKASTAFEEVIGSMPVLRCFLSEPKAYVLLHSAEELYPLLKDILMEKEKKRDDSFYSLELWYLMAKIARMHAENNGRKAAVNGYVEKAKAYIYRNYDKAMKVGDIAAAVSLHENYLQRLFKKVEGTSITAFLLQYRLEKAKMLLESTDIKIAGIPAQVGIESRQYFYEKFRLQYGMSPGELRRTYGECQNQGH